MHSESISQILKINFPGDSKVPEKLVEIGKRSQWIPQEWNVSPEPCELTWVTGLLFP